VYLILKRVSKANGIIKSLNVSLLDSPVVVKGYPTTHGESFMSPREICLSMYSG